MPDGCRNASIFAFHASEGQEAMIDCGVPRGRQGLTPTRLWHLALRPGCSAYGDKIYSKRYNSQPSASYLKREVTAM